jgi:YHS domain-containing protein
MNIATAVKDPVCGMDLEMATAAGQTEHKGQTYYFCAPSAKRCSTLIRSNTWASLRESRRAAMVAAVKPNVSENSDSLSLISLYSSRAKTVRAQYAAPVSCEVKDKI